MNVLATQATKTADRIPTMPYFYLTPKQDNFNQIPSRVSRMSASGRLLPFTNATFWFGERPFVGESGHWDASSKSHVYDIHERLLSARSGRRGLYKRRTPTFGAGLVADDVRLAMMGPPYVS